RKVVSSAVRALCVKMQSISLFFVSVILLPRREIQESRFYVRLEDLSMPASDLANMYPIRYRRLGSEGRHEAAAGRKMPHRMAAARDRKSTRLNSSHVKISYAVFCLKKR